MRKRLHIPWRLTLALVPATLVTIVTAALLGVFVVLPAVSHVDFLRASRSVPGVDDGALLVIDRIGSDGVAAGDVVVVATRPSGESVVYAVPAVTNGFAVLSESPGGSTLTLPRGDVRIRVTRSITGVGDAYAFIDSAPGWTTVLGSTVVAWVVTMGLIGWRRRWGRRAVSSDVAFLPAPPPTAAVPVLQRPPLQAQRAPSRAPVASALIAAGLGYAPQHNGVGVRVDDTPPTVGHVSNVSIRELARPSPQRWLGEIQRRTAIRPPRETARWAGLGAVAAVVASATLLVAEENHRRQARRRQFRRPTSTHGRFTRFL